MLFDSEYFLVLLHLVLQHWRSSHWPSWNSFLKYRIPIPNKLISIYILLWYCFFMSDHGEVPLYHLNHFLLNWIYIFSCFQYERLRGDLIVCCVVTVLAFAVHVSTVFTSPALQVNGLIFWVTSVTSPALQVNGLFIRVSSVISPALQVNSLLV
jgi:hypothetical protein